MTWVKLDEDFPDHPKIAALGPLAPLAGWLHVCSLCYCNRFLTNGFIPNGMIEKLSSFAFIGIETARAHVASFGHDIEHGELVDALVRVGLWEDAENGYQIHDYLDYQPARDDKIAKMANLRHKRCEAGKKGAAQRWGKWQTDGTVPVSVTDKDKTLAHGKEFEEFWEAYPRKVAKTATRKAWQARMKEGIDPSLLVRCSRNYAKTRVGEDEKYTAYPSTFLGPQHKYEDYAEAPKAAQVLYAKP